MFKEGRWRLMESILKPLLLGERLRSYRVAKKLTRKEFAEQCDISERYLADIERGIKVPKLETFIRIANAAGVSADYLLQDCLTAAKAPSVNISNVLRSLTAEQQEIAAKFLIDFVNSTR